MSDKEGRNEGREEGRQREVQFTLRLPRSRLGDISGTQPARFQTLPVEQFEGLGGGSAGFDRHHRAGCLAGHSPVAVQRSELKQLLLDGASPVQVFPGLLSRGCGRRE